MSFKSSEITSLASILASPFSKPCILETTLKTIFKISIHSSAGVPLLTSENFAILDELLKLFNNKLNIETILSILVNVSAYSESLNERIIDNESFIVECTRLASTVKEKQNETNSNLLYLRSVQLLANISRHFPEKVLNVFNKHWSNYLTVILDLLLTTARISEFDYLGYVLMNLSTISLVREKLARDHLKKILLLLSPQIYSKRRFCSANIVYNLSFDDHLHSWLLKEVSEHLIDEDAFLVSIMKPLADSNDVLTDEEIEKLPLHLQYYEGCRETDLIILRKLIEALYQLCATKIGRETLRNKGIYAILRELDKSLYSTTMLSPNAIVTDDKIKIAPPSKNSQNNKMNSQLDKEKNEISNLLETTLHALIGILIRYESEMCISDDTFSLRHLSEEQTTNASYIIFNNAKV